MQNDPVTPPGYGSNLYSVGGVYGTDSAPGMHFLAAWKLLLGGPKSVNPAGGCLDLGEQPKPCGPTTADAAVVSGQDETGATTGPGGLAPEYVTYLNYFAVHNEGRWALGGYLDSHAPATEAHATVLWLDFLP
jgi:hypothetical protein